MFSGIDFLLQRTMSSFFIAIKNLLTAYHIDKQSTGKIIEPKKYEKLPQYSGSFLYLQTDKITDFIIQYPYILFLRGVS
ncbi:hypothetical protein [Lactobacillus helveticus]